MGESKGFGSRVLASLTVILVLGACNRPAPQPVKPDESSGGRERTVPVVTAQGSYADIVDRVAPAVVTIQSARRVRAPQQFPFALDPFFQEFFGGRLREQAPQPRIQRGLGSGVIVRADGYILTNHHVIDGAQEIRVELIDRRTFEANLVGSDPPSDIAVLKVKGSGLPVLHLGNSEKVRVGDIALAVGNPLGVGQTVTAGIISAKGRTTGISDGSFEDFLQTDAPINQGNSGGALVSTAAELIGINSQIVTPSGGNIGIGFAIPSNMAKHVMDQLIKSGEVRRGQLGVTIQPLTSDLARSFGMKDTSGVVINGVQPGGPADRAGIKAGDVIRKVNGRDVANPNELRNSIAGSDPGSSVKVVLWRDGREMEVTVKLGELRLDVERER